MNFCLENLLLRERFSQVADNYVVADNLVAASHQLAVVKCVVASLCYYE